VTADDSAEAAPGLCGLMGWRLERVAGEHPGYLIALVCEHGHLHMVAHSPLHGEALRIARAWERETFGEDYPGLPVDDRALGRVLPGGMSGGMS
jgi:hypothetical protein